MNPTTKRGFRIAHLNYQSINNKFDIIKQQIRDANFDIFTLSETWLTSDNSSNLLEIQGYNLIRLDRSWPENNNPFPKMEGGYYSTSSLILPIPLQTWNS